MSKKTEYTICNNRDTFSNAVGCPSRAETKLRRDFLISQRYTMRDLSSEIDANHFATAHRLVHTLKGTASLIREKKLALIAFDVEQQLRKRDIPAPEYMDALENELNRVLTEITESGVLNEESFNAPPEPDEQTSLFNKLHLLLIENDAACIELIPEISLIPETKVLVRQVENFAFKNAIVTLQVLREVLEV
ncbi:MAG: Hpt domain-containing protein [Defluviitaleaceae bacterium]|nr:Hpt domain-containing protein [Defluviitaleaceae bacterium]